MLGWGAVLVCIRRLLAHQQLMLVGLWCLRVLRSVAFPCEYVCKVADASLHFSQAPQSPRGPAAGGPRQPAWNAARPHLTGLDLISSAASNTVAAGSPGEGAQGEGADGLSMLPPSVQELAGSWATVGAVLAVVFMDLES